MWLVDAIPRQVNVFSNSTHKVDLEAMMAVVNTAIRAKVGSSRICTSLPWMHLTLDVGCRIACGVFVKKWV